MKRTEMNQISIAERKHSFKQFLLGYTKDEAIKEASRCLNCKNPSCVQGCPINNRIPEFIHEIVEDNIMGAYQILLDKTVLPEICGTVCPHNKQCEGNCVKGIKGDSVTIGALERYVGEYIRKNNLDDLSYKANNKKVAIVGSGPAGMASAYYLAKHGYQVTIYEKENYLGGVLSWGIPSFRLDKQIIKNYFEKLQKLNVKFVMNCNVGIDVTLDELKNNNDYVILAIGALLSNSMNILGEDLPFVVQAKSFLTELSLLNDEQLSINDKYGKSILVVGGGNVAMDAARSAIRLKDVEKVSIIYRRTIEEMPANKEELNQAIEEGVEFITLTNPIKIHEDHKVECALMQLGEIDASGRRRPIESDKEHIFIDVDTVIMAIGFNNDPLICDKTQGLQKDNKGKIVVNDNYETSLKNVYAVGDSVNGPDRVVIAMKQALIACRHIIENNN